MTGKAGVNATLDFHKDVTTELAPYVYAKLGFRPGDQPTLFKDVFQPGVKNNFPMYEKMLACSKSGFFAPSGLTFVDFIIADYFFTLNKLEPDTMAGYSTLVEFMNRVLGLPKLKNYVSTRKE